ncbi:MULTISPECIES: hypothetical protein [Asticcacaulis]|uniref:hypothetical protein n=1 Tax=Asticcacaulis TaxID=76890 RepID=UPI001AE5359C|nr:MULTISPECIES: hypothetical protein [Asticcacaulis]MBP2159799.1 hypothetical protein [Asticcacaulis solisilvae]MDR6800844.1 hypothetical protein [Asticcacaulis sp. BE141]
MQNRKLKPSSEAPHIPMPEPADVPVAIADASTATSVPSPARGLQASLQQQLEGAASASRPIPFGWTALGMIAFCTAFWTAVVYVLT